MRWSRALFLLRPIYNKPSRCHGRRSPFTPAGSHSKPVPRMLGIVRGGEDDVAVSARVREVSKRRNIDVPNGTAEEVWARAGVRQAGVMRRRVGGDRSGRHQSAHCIGGNLQTRDAT